jgi:hypothetical protein
MPHWFDVELARRQHPDAAIAFTGKFLAAPAAERSEVEASWDGKLEWALPKFWRLACKDEAPGSPLERIRATLLFEALSNSQEDPRDLIVVLAVIHNSCKLAGIDPAQVFEEVTSAVDGSAAGALRQFARRDPENQSMEAFLLIAVPNPGGGYELRPNW